jgi:hypothetical protein
MKLAALLGKKLKDEEILQVLDDYQVGDVSYEFDRLREGNADEYFAQAQGAGFALVFDHEQILRTVFCYAASIEGFTPVSPAILGVPVFASFEDATQAARAEGVAHSSGQVDRLTSSWIRHERPASWAHYEFRAGVLALITLSCPP